MDTLDVVPGHHVHADRLARYYYLSRSLHRAYVLYESMYA